MSSDQAVFMHYSYLAPTFDNTIAKVLISNGADVTHVYALDMTPLLSVVFSGNDEIVEMLLIKGANVNEKDSDGYSGPQKSDNGVRW
jgi:ankyrin repeat protein